MTAIFDGSVHLEAIPQGLCHRVMAQDSGWFYFRAGVTVLTELGR
jgi:hypothetical protein